MSAIKRETAVDESVVGGFGTVDEKGRISLSKPARTALGIEPGSTLAWVVVDGALLLIPQDAHLAELMERGSRALAAAGLTTQDLLDELPAARDEVFAESFSGEFLRELEQLWTTYRGGADER